MTEQKRLYSVPKHSVGRHNGKLKDILTSTRHKSETKSESGISNIPIIKQFDNFKLLPKYTAIVHKPGDDGVSMDDLDQLQQDLERLLSTSAQRIRYFLSEIEDIDDILIGRKGHGKTSLKRKRDDKVQRYKEGVKNGVRLVKRHSLPVKYIYDQEIPKVTLPKNDNSDKFWASIEPFCTNVSRDDIVFLDSLIQECSKDITVRIPEVGEHYSKSWSESIINDEHNMEKPLSNKSSQQNDVKKNALHAMIESFSSPQTQKLLAKSFIKQSLLEERILNSLPKLNESNNKVSKSKIKPFDITKSKMGQKLGICFDRRLKKQLVQQGILTMEDLTKSVPADEILTEINKCQKELITVNEYNTEELIKLKSVATIDLRSNDLEEELEEVDKELLDLYNMIIARKKTAWQEEDFDKNVFIKEVTEEFENKANLLLSKQFELNRKINELMDTAVLY